MSKLKNSIKFTLMVITILLLTSQNITLAAIQKINDVKADDPNIGIYGDVVNNNALSLDQNGNLRPDAPINRAAFLKAALTYAGFQPGKTFNNFTGYSDVPEESWFAPYVKKALDAHVIENPLLNSRFNPNDNITRQEALFLTLKIYGIPIPLEEPTSKELFQDIRPNHPLAHIYMAAFLNAIYFENDQLNFRPNKILTRGDAADLIFKAKMATGKETIRVNANPVVTVNSTQSDLINNDKFNILLDTWDRINQQYVYTDKVNADKLLYGAISGMVDQLGDPYSNFRAPNPDGQAYIYIPENYEGIGAVIDQQGDNFIVQTTINNSPADRAGLKAQDIIVLLDGKEIKGLTPEQVTGMIKGKAGTYLKLQIKRGSQLMDFSIIREKINLEAIHREVVGNNINYLRIDQFTENSNQEFDSLLSDLKNSGSQKLIIDLRNNPGGYLTATQSILGHFLDKDQVEFYTQDKNKTLTPFYSEGPADLKNFKTVILINEGSASASEIMSGALQDTKLARLIGTTSFGKGSVQEITEYGDNSSLKLSIAQWLTPNKRNINHVGITPDQVVTITDQQKANGQDPQLDAAISYLQ